MQVMSKHIELIIPYFELELGCVGLLECIMTSTMKDIIDARMSGQGSLQRWNRRCNKNEANS